MLASSQISAIGSGRPRVPPDLRDFIEPERNVRQARRVLRLTY